MLTETNTLVGTYGHRETLTHGEKAHMLSTYKRSGRQLEKTRGRNEREWWVDIKPGEAGTELRRAKLFPKSSQILCEEKTKIIHRKSCFPPQLSTPVLFCGGDRFYEQKTWFAGGQAPVWPLNLDLWWPLSCQVLGNDLRKVDEGGKLHLFTLSHFACDYSTQLLQVYV